MLAILIIASLQLFINPIYCQSNAIACVNWLNTEHAKWVNSGAKGPEPTLQKCPADIASSSPSSSGGESQKASMSPSPAVPAVPASGVNSGPAECSGISGGCLACHHTYDKPKFTESGLGCAGNDIDKVEQAAKDNNYMIIGTSDASKCYQKVQICRKEKCVNAIYLDVNGGSDDVSWPVFQAMGGEYCGGNRLQATIKPI